MSYEIIPTNNFNREVKKLAKKYRSIANDLEKLEKELSENPNLGDNLGNNVFKVRMAITSKGKGKSSGARLITHVFALGEKLFLLSVYDKSEKENITDDEIKQLLKDIDIE
jgi:hypothetical protein